MPSDRRSPPSALPGVENASHTARVDEVATAVLSARARLGGVRLVAVDGPSGSGKSTVAGVLTARLRARGVSTELVSTDDFATWADPVSWWPELVETVLDRLAAGAPGRYRRTDWSSGVPLPGSVVDVSVPDVLVLEGVSSGRASVRPRLSFLCWVCDPDPRSRLERAVARDGESCRQHLRAWQNFEQGWFAVDETARHAHRMTGPSAGTEQGAEHTGPPECPDGSR